jgi:hypothetical protein
MQMFPLLCKGFYSNPNGTAPSITALQLTANRGWSNQTPTGRGNMVALDVMKTQVRNDNGFDALITVALGGVQIITNASLNNYVLFSRSTSYQIANLDQPEGQTLALSTNGLTALGGAVVHTYFRNGWNQPAVWAALETSKLKCRYQDFSFTGPGGTKGITSGNLTVPTGKGNVVGIMLLAENDGTTDEPGTALVTVRFNGINVLEEVSAYLGMPECMRPGLIFPMVVQGGSTFEIVGDTNNGLLANQIKLGMRLFFDDQITTTPYSPIC